MNTINILLELPTYSDEVFFVLSPMQAPESYKNVTDVVNTCKCALLAVQAYQ